MSDEDKSGKVFGIPTAAFTALISALATVAVAAIGILPNITKSYEKQITALEAKQASLQERLDQQEKQEPPEPEKTWNVKGTLTKDVEGQATQIPNAYIYLAPLGKGLDFTTGSDGGFVFTGIPSGHYMLLVVDDEGAAKRGLIDVVEPMKSTTELAASKVNFTIAANP